MYTYDTSLLLHIFPFNFPVRDKIESERDRDTMWEVISGNS